MMQLSMLMRRHFETIMDTKAGWVLRHYYRYYMMPSAVRRGYLSSLWKSHVNLENPKQHANTNVFEEFFDGHASGNGIWKWRHYFDIYEKHFAKFRGKSVNVLEIGVYSGGSLEMWERYFGTNANIYGVDINDACRIYETSRIKIFIGDQKDRHFWREVKLGIPALDIVIDDGGHGFEQQVASIEELLPFMRPGGVYICEDLHGVFNRFASYVHGLSHKLNDYGLMREFRDDNERRIVCDCTAFQSAIGSIHFYPFVTVLERNDHKVTELISQKHGTQWQPFLN
jgi:hypothetical protein